MTPTLWGVLAAAVTGLLGYLGARYTAQSSRRASQYSALLSAPDNISAGYDRLNDDLWRSVTALQEDVAALKVEVTRSQQMYRASIAYIRVLLSLLTIHAPHVRLPDPPPELAEDVQIVNGKEPQP